MKQYQVVARGAFPSVLVEPLRVYHSRFDYSAIEAFQTDYGTCPDKLVLYRIDGFNSAGDYIYRRMTWN